MILQLRDNIKDMLTSGFEERNLKPFVMVSSFPDTKESLDNMQKKAKVHSKGSVYITWTAERPGERVGVIYPRFIDVFSIFIFSNDRDDDTEIINIYEASRDILNTKYYLYYGEMSPVKTPMTGLYMAVIQVGLENIYQGVS